MHVLTCRYMKTAAQMMIRWCLQSGFICIPKTQRGDKILEYCDVFDFNISDEDMVALVSGLCGSEGGGVTVESPNSDAWYQAICSNL